MGKITFRHPSDSEFQGIADTASEELKSRYTAEELAGMRRSIFPQDGESLQLFEIQLDPDTPIPAHAHDAPEIIVVTAGSIQMGAHTCTAGTAIYIDAETLYAFTAGPEGCRFLNFRPQPGTGYLSKADLLAHRKASYPFAND